MVSRRQLMKWAGIAGASSLAGCLGGGDGGDGSGGEQEIGSNLIVFSWYEQWLNEMEQNFAEQHDGLTIDHTGYSSNQELYSKLKAAGTDGADFVLPSNNMLTRLRDQDMIQPINTDWIDNWDLQQPIADEQPWSDFVKADGEYWGVPFARGSYMNAVPQSKLDDGTVSEDLIESWDIYFEDTDARTGIKDYGRRNVSIVIWHLQGEDGDINEDPGNAVSWSKIEDKLVEMIQNSKTIYSSSEDARRLISQDQLDVVNVWGGDVIQLRNLSGIEDAQGFMPKEGSNGWFDSFAIPKEAPNTYTSHKFMDYILKPENMLREYELEGNIAVQEGLMDKMSDEKKEKFGFLLEMDQSKLQPYKSDDELQNRATEAWNNAKSRA